MKKRGLRKRTRDARAARAKTSRSDIRTDDVRRLHVVEGGRQGTEPRRRVSGQPAPPKHGVPLAIRRRRRLAVCILALLAAGLITYVLLGPILSVIQSHRNLSQAEAQLSEEQARSQALQDKKEFETTDQYVEGKARENGYVKPGEIPIIVLDVQNPEQSDDQANSQATDDSAAQSTNQNSGP
jgi:cell division protein FtsB